MGSGAARAIDPPQIDSQLFGVAAPTCAEETQLALNRCAARWAKTTDFLRSLIYQELDEQLSPAMQNQLKTIDRTWQSYRELHCQESSEPFKSGSIYPLLYNNCLATLSNDRIADLQGVGEKSLTPAATTARLRSILTQANVANSPAQRQWQRYQQQHCQWASQHFTDSRYSRQCQQDLATRRIRQIQKTIDIR